MRSATPLLLAAALLAGCKKDPEGTDTSGTEDTGPTEPQNLYPLPDDIDTIDFVGAFRDAVTLMSTVSTQQPWLGHTTSLDVRAPGCPDFWTGPFTDAGILVGNDFGVSWYDDCLTTGGDAYDGWIWWDFDVVEYGDPTTLEGRTAEASRRLEGDGLVRDPAGGVKFEFDGEASDSFYRVDAYGYSRFVYSTTVDATVTGADIFGPDALTPDGFRTDLFMSITGGDVDTFQARGNVYFFTPQLHGRFDSIAVDMSLVGPTGAAPTDCQLEPLGWIGLRDADALWYDVVFLPRFREDIVGEPYPNDPLSVCDGCGRLYVQGIEQEGMEICVDFSFLFDGSFPLPDPDDYVLPLHAL